MNKSPCANCVDRDVSCHSTCTKYKEWFNDLRIEKAKISKSVELERSLSALDRSLSRCSHKVYCD